jgi:hypothetical protein
VEILKRGVESIKLTQASASASLTHVKDKEEDEDFKLLEAALVQVESLQHSLLQANNDAMRVSSRILQHLHIQ